MLLHVLGALLGRWSLDPSLPAPRHVRNQGSFPMPVLAANVDIAVMDFCASVTIRQTFINTESDPIEATYEFEIDEHAAVSEFTAVVDGEQIRGVIQEKEQARDSYEDAIASGHGAYKMEEREDAPYIFSVDVGNLPPGKKAEIVITYVTELQLEDGQLKLTIPSSDNNRSAIRATEKEMSSQFQLSVNLNMTSSIKNIQSNSRLIKVEMSDTPGEARVSFSTQSAGLLSDSLIVFVELEDPHKPCGRVQMNEAGRKTVMAAFYPQLKLAEESITVQTEMIFIVDRSGSMAGSRIRKVTETLQIFLRSLTEGILFNIVGFGSKTEHLFPMGSVEYNDTNLEIAANHVAYLTANLGGTNILKPLQEVLKSQPKKGYSRQVFLLTDGEVDNKEECIRFVRANAETTRVFTFGIGRDASQDLIRGLAQAGEGNYEFIREGEAMEVKIMRQLQRALTPALTDVNVIWQGGITASTVKPAPFRFAPIFSGERLVAYGILGEKHDEEAIEVELEANFAGASFRMRIKIDLANCTHGELLHKLAAKALLKDLDEGRSYLHARKDVSPEDVIAESVRVSLDNGVLSKYTAFVAVEMRDQETTASTMKLRKISIKREQQRDQTSMISGVVPRGVITLQTADQYSRNEAAGCCGGGGGGYYVPSSAAPPQQRPSTSGETRTPVHSTSAEMRALISKQKANGSWDWHDVVTAVPVEPDQLRSAVPITHLVQRDVEQETVESLWATAVMAALLMMRFPDHKTMWDLVVRKAVHFIGKHKSLFFRGENMSTPDAGQLWLGLATKFLTATVKPRP